MKPAAQKLTYDDHVLPILETSCTNCHNPDKKKGDLDLTTFRGLMAGSSGGQVVTAGDGASSKMFTTSSHLVEPFMPPKGDRLGKKEIDIIRSWIDGGLLETKDSKAKKNDAPQIDFSGIDTNKPSGAPPIPMGLSTEPVIIPERAGFVADIESSPWAPVLAITGQKQVLLYNTDTTDLIGVLPFPEKKGNPESLSFHPSGKYLLAGGGVQGKYGTTVTWDILTGKQIMQTGREYDSVIASSLRADLQAVATSGPSRLIKMWLTADNSLENNIKKHTDWVTSLAYSHDGVLLATADRNGGLYVWEAETGNPFHNLRGHIGQIVSLKWSPDSNFLASASEDGGVRIWNMDSGKEVKKLDAHRSGVLDMDWSPKGELITVGRDNTVKLWKSDYNLLKQIKNEGSMLTKVEWTYDGLKFVTVDFGGNVSVWDSKTYKVVGKLSANPESLTRRLIAAQKNLVEQQKIAQQKKGGLDQKTQQKDAHQKRINGAKDTHKKSTNLVNKLNNEIKQHQNKINQLTRQQGSEKSSLSKINAQRGALDKKLKQLNAKIIQFKNHLKGPNQLVMNLGKEINTRKQQIKQIKGQIIKEPENKELEKKLKEINKKLVGSEAELNKQQGKKNALIKQYQSTEKEVLKLKQEQDTSSKLYDTQRKKIDGLNNQKKALYETIKQKQIEVTKHRKLADLKKREAQDLQKKLTPFIEQEKKYREDFEAFSKTLLPYQQKLERLRDRVKLK